MSGIYPVPKFIQRFEERVEQMWSDRWNQQAAARHHSFVAELVPPEVPCGCGKCDPTGDHYRDWLGRTNV